MSLGPICYTSICVCVNILQSKKKYKDIYLLIIRLQLEIIYKRFGFK